jgi:transcriptional regulator with XRE-family HTH domain
MKSTSLRVERGLRREQVAKRLPRALAHVEGHERGTRRIEPRDLATYARLFRVQISDFFKDRPQRDAPEVALNCTTWNPSRPENG